MRMRDNRWITRFLAASCLGAALCGPPAAGAAERVQVAMAAPSDDDLSLFWDEKELYVQTATRSEKPIGQVAENMTVITAREIEAMNANSVAEVLARVTGLFVVPGTNDFASSAQLRIQGSEPRHVTVLLDGVPLNMMSGGNADTSFIPVRIVERIEVVKGPASSAWGSALGGVVNIITRQTGDKLVPNGMLGASLGEAYSRNTEFDLAGKDGMVGYYLYGGQLASEGLRNRRDYRRNSVFGKFLITPNRDLDITLSAGFSTPEESAGELQPAFISARTLVRDLVLNSAFEYRATPELTVRGGLHMFQSYLDQPVHWLWSFPLSPGQLRIQNVYDERAIGANLRATWASGIQTLTVGGELSHGAFDQTTNAGPLFQAFGYPPTVMINSHRDTWGLFANDTVEFGPLSVTPGIRLDHDRLIGSFISPSLGATYELSEHAVLRASVARGFTSPPLGYLAGSGPYFTANRDLKPEYGWSYQAGIESGLADWANLKATLYRHETGKAITQVGFPATVINAGNITRQGYELEAESVPYYNLSLKLGHAYMHAKADAVTAGYANNYYDNYSWLIGVKYDDRRSLTALLSGSYVFWGIDPSYGFNADKYKTFIWDLTGTKKLQLTDKTTIEAFATVHNIFSGAYYSISAYPNPNRWVEGGLRYRF